MRDRAKKEQYAALAEEDVMEVPMRRNPLHARAPQQLAAYEARSEAIVGPKNSDSRSPGRRLTSADGQARTMRE